MYSARQATANTSTALRDCLLMIFSIHAIHTHTGYTNMLTLDKYQNDLPIDNVNLDFFVE